MSKRQSTSFEDLESKKIKSDDRPTTEQPEDVDQPELADIVLPASPMPLRCFTEYWSQNSNDPISPVDAPAEEEDCKSNVESTDSLPDLESDTNEEQTFTDLDQQKPIECDLPPITNAPSTSDGRTTQEEPHVSEKSKATTPTVLDTYIMFLLGADPSDKPGSDFREELASRLQHIATQGLAVEEEKELLTKYPIPHNCPLLGSPITSREIKGAISHDVASRDKDIDRRQKLMAIAISCVGEIMNTQLNSEDKDKFTLLQKLMDVVLILCNLQHDYSVDRRTVILKGVKKKLKEHLTNTKIDKYLFTHDTLKTDSELKASSPPKKTKPASRKPK